MVELGRHQYIDREYRYCPICNTNDIHVLEDEMHFMFVCQLYNTLRVKYFKTHWLNSSVCTRLFYQVMSENDNSSIVCIAKYLYNAFELRNISI